MQTILLTIMIVVASVWFIAAQTVPAPVVVPVLPNGVTRLPDTPLGNYDIQLSPPNLVGPKLLDMTQIPKGVRVTEAPDTGGGKHYYLQIDQDALPRGTKVEVRTDEDTQKSIVVTVTPSPTPTDENHTHKPEVNDNKDTGLWTMFVDFWKTWGCLPFIALLFVLSLLVEFVARIKRS